MLRWRADIDDPKATTAIPTDRAAVLGGGVLALLMLLAVAISEQGDTVSLTASPPEGAGVAAAGDMETGATAAPGGAGLITPCKEVFGALGEASVSGSTFETLTTSWSETNTARPALSSISRLVITATDMQAKGVSIVFASPAGNGCAGDFVRVVPVPLDCASVSAGLPKDSKRAPDYQGVDLVTIPSGWKVALVPAPNETCVVVTSAFFTSSPP